MKYTTFYNLFLSEMPQRASGLNSFEAHLAMLRENLEYNNEVIQVTSDIFKTENGEDTTYWIGDRDASTVYVIVEISSEDNKFCKIVLASKNPQLQHGTKPYASDLYLVIKQDISPYHLVLTSDELLSDDGERLWKGLVNRGNTVSVYDTEAHQYILNRVSSEQELNNYLGGADMRKYIFVLSESITESRNISHTFAIMEIKRKANWPLFDHLINKE
jgi:hypothetical protein